VAVRCCGLDSLKKRLFGDGAATRTALASLARLTLIVALLNDLQSGSPRNRGSGDERNATTEKSRAPFIEVNLSSALFFKSNVFTEHG
jgi:hypothetical protein